MSEDVLLSTELSSSTYIHNKYGEIWLFVTLIYIPLGLVFHLELVLEVIMVDNFWSNSHISL